MHKVSMKVACLWFGLCSFSLISSPIQAQTVQSLTQSAESQPFPSAPAGFQPINYDGLSLAVAGTAGTSLDELRLRFTTTSLFDDHLAMDVNGDGDIDIYWSYLEFDRADNGAIDSSYIPWFHLEPIELSIQFLATQTRIEARINGNLVTPGASYLAGMGLNTLGFDPGARFPGSGSVTLPEIRTGAINEAGPGSGDADIALNAAQVEIIRNHRHQLIYAPEGLYYMGGTANNGVAGPHGVALNGLSFGDGFLGQGAIFETHPETIQLPGVLVDGQQDISLALWFNTATASGTLFSTVDSLGADALRLFFEGGDLKLDYLGSTLLSSLPLGDGTWHHVALTRNGLTGGLTLYLDGRLRATATGPTGILDIDSAGFYLGQEQNGLGVFDEPQRFVGAMDDVRIYQRLLHDSDITAIYGLGRSVPKAIYQFDGNMDDSSGLGNHATAIATAGTSANGFFADALALVGDDGYVDLPHTLIAETSQLSISLWFKTTGAGSILSGTPVGSRNAFNLFINTSGTLEAHKIQIDTGTKVVTDDHWHHLLYTHETTTGRTRTYLDGELDLDVIQDTGFFQQAAASLFLGQEQDTPGGGFDPLQNFEGMVDRMTFYPIVLTQADARAFYAEVGSAAAAQTTVTLAGGDLGAANQINLNSHDGLGRRLTSGGATALASTTGAHSLNIPMTDHGDGSYSGTWMVAATGIDDVLSSLDGTPVGAAPEQITNRPHSFNLSLAQSLAVDASNFSDMALADINSDGFLDLILITTGAGSRFYLNSATGFDAGTALPSITLADKIAVGDLNGDERPDLIISESNDLDRVLINSGSAPYFPSISASLTASDVQTNALRLFDVDGDEDLDLAVATNSLNRLYINDGSGNLSSTYDITTQNNITRGIATFDVNGDGHADLVTTTDNGDDMLLINSGTAPYFDDSTAHSLGSRGDGHSIASGDFNGDGHQDLIFSGTPGRMYLNNREGNLDLINAIDLAGFASFDVLTVADVNQDGLDDIISASGSLAKMFLSNGSSQPFSNTPLDLSSNTTISAIVVADGHRDGDGDLFLAENGGAVLYKNQRITPDAGMTTLEITQGDLLNPTFLTVQIRDHLGDPYPLGGDTVTLSVSGANTATPAVTDVGNGTYTTAYVATSPGTDAIAVSLNGTPILNSPFALENAGATDATMSVALVGDGTVGQPTEITIQARDSNGVNRPVGGDTVSVTLTGTNAQGFSITDHSDGTYSGSYTPNLPGVDTITILLNGVAIMGSPFTSNVNGPPTAADDVAFTGVNQPVVIAVLNNDTDYSRAVDPATVIASDPPHGTVVVNPNGSIGYTPDLDFVGSDSFTYTYRDDFGAESNLATVTVYVNDGPTAIDDNARVLDGASVIIDVLSNDVAVAGLDTSSLAIVATPGQGNAVVNGDGTISYTPNLPLPASDSFTYQVDDLDGMTSAAATVTITFMRTPLALNDNYIVQKGIPQVLNPVANDIDLDGNATLDLTSLALTSPAAKGSVSFPGDGTAIYSPAPGQTGLDNFMYTIADLDGNVSAQAMVTILINIPPLALNDSFQVFDSQATDLSVIANDFDTESSLNPTSVSVITQPSHGTVQLKFNGDLTYTPDPGYWGSDSFSYHVADTQGGISNVATVSLDVLVYIPDAAYKAALVALHDTSGDGEISYAETAGVLEIHVPSLGITDLKGTEAFADLRSLIANDNLVATLVDISGLVDLDYIDLSHNVIDTLLGLPPGNAPLAAADPYESVLNLSHNRLYYQPDLTTNHFTAIDLSYNRSGPPPPTPKRVQTEYFDYNLVDRATTESVKVEGNGSSCIKGDREQKRAGGILKLLNISNNLVPDFDPLIFPTTLEVLEMADNRILNFPDLTSYNTLKELTCGENRYNSVPVSNLPTSLESLDLAGLRMRNQPDLSAFSALLDLNLGSNRFSSIDPLLLPTSLVLFNMEDNIVLNQPDLSLFLAMTDLDMSDNLLSSIDPLLLPPNLINLDISGNRIPSAPALGTPKRGGSTLQALDLSHNKLKQLSLADLPPSMTSLKLNGNRLTSLPNLASFNSLTILSAAENALSNVQGNQLPTSLTHLDLSHNRLAQTPDVGAMLDLIALYVNDNTITTFSDFTFNNQLQILALHNNSLGAVPQSSPFPISLRRLDLSGNSLTDTPDLSGLTALVWLNLSETAISQLPILNGSTSLQQLLASKNHISSLDPLLLPESLVELNLTQNQLTVLPDLSSLRFITHLELNQNQLTTLLNPLPAALRSLKLQQNQIHTWPDLSTAPYVNVLDLSQNQLSSVVAPLPQGLRSLDLSFNLFQEVPDLSTIIRLWELDLGGNTLTPFDATKIPADLRDLGLQNTGIASFPDLASFHILESINVAGNTLTTLDPARLPATLDRLNLSGNQITSLPDLSSFLLLQGIDLSGNQLAVLDGDLLPESISELQLGANNITTVMNLEFLELLEDLDLGGNQLGTLSSLPLFLRTLNLKNAQVDALPNLDLLTQLQSCELGGNQLTTLPDLATLQSLTQLGLGDNDFEDVSFLPPNLESVYFGGNTIDPLTLPALASLEALDMSRTNLQTIPDLSGFVSVATLDLRWNEIEDLTGFPSVPGLGSQAFHIIRIDNNLLDFDDCDAIQDFEAISQPAGASFTYSNQGNLGLFQETLPPWSSPANPGYLFELISSLNTNSFGYDLNCGE